MMGYDKLQGALDLLAFKVLARGPERGAGELGASGQRRDEVLRYA
jgi:hypothetical protein